MADKNKQIKLSTGQLFFIQAAATIIFHIDEFHWLNRVQNVLLIMLVDQSKLLLVMIIIDGAPKDSETLLRLCH